MKVRLDVVIFICSAFLFFGCSSNSTKEKKDDILSGTLPVSVDETLLPIFLEQKEVFESSYYNAKINSLAHTEVDAINALLKGEAQIAFLTRELTKEENKFFENKSIKPRIYPVGYDGIIVVSHVNSVDTSITAQGIIEGLQGAGMIKKKLVFDHLNSSVLRYFVDMGKIAKLSNTNIETVKGAQEVLKNVAQQDGKLGFISYNQYLSLKRTFSEMDKIRILSVLNDGDSVQRYVLPSQASLSTGEYPLKRPIYVLNYQPNMGLGIGFSAFLTGDRGQRILLKAGLLPATMPGREIIIRNEIN